VIMFCAFDGPPRIVRFHGRGTVVVRDEPRFDDLLAMGGFEDASLPAARRSIVDVDVTRVSDSCGYLVPPMSVQRQREHHQLSTPSACAPRGWTASGSIAQAGGYRGQMAVVVKPNSLLGTGCMAAIKPFRHLLVYPPMLRQIGRERRARERRT